MASTINIPLPDDLKAYVEAKMEAGDFETAEQYVTHLIQHDRNERRLALERRLLDALHDEKDAIEIPDEVLEHGDIVTFLEMHERQDSERT